MRAKKLHVHTEREAVKQGELGKASRKLPFSRVDTDETRFHVILTNRAERPPFQVPLPKLIDIVE